ncbi:hypothetical protein FB107DRAFT_250877 [Schizophyllum commune]
MPLVRQLSSAVNVLAGKPNATMSGYPMIFSTLRLPQAPNGSEVSSISPEAAQCHCVRAPQWSSASTRLRPTMRCTCVNGLPSQPDATADGQLNASNLRHENITDLANSPDVAKTGSLKGISHTDRRLEVRAVNGNVSRKARLRADPASPPNTADTGSLNDCSPIARGASSRNGHPNFQVIEWQCSKGSSLVSTKGRQRAAMRSAGQRSPASTKTVNFYPGKRLPQRPRRDVIYFDLLSIGQNIHYEISFGSSDLRCSGVWREVRRWLRERSGWPSGHDACMVSDVFPVFPRWPPTPLPRWLANAVNILDGLQNSSTSHPPSPTPRKSVNADATQEHRSLTESDQCHRKRSAQYLKLHIQPLDALTDATGIHADATQKHQCRGHARASMSMLASSPNARKAGRSMVSGTTASRRVGSDA